MPHLRFRYETPINACNFWASLAHFISISCFFSSHSLRRFWVFKRNFIWSLMRRKYSFNVCWSLIAVQKFIEQNLQLHHVIWTDRNHGFTGKAVQIKQQQHQFRSSTFPFHELEWAAGQLQCRTVTGTERTYLWTVLIQQSAHSYRIVCILLFVHIWFSPTELFIAKEEAFNFWIYGECFCSWESLIVLRIRWVCSYYARWNMWSLTNIWFINKLRNL